MGPKFHHRPEQILPKTLKLHHTQRRIKIDSKREHWFSSISNGWHIQTESELTWINSLMPFKIHEISRLNSVCNMLFCRTKCGWWFTLMYTRNSFPKYKQLSENNTYENHTPIPETCIIRWNWILSRAHSHKHIEQQKHSIYFVIFLLFKKNVYWFILKGLQKNNWREKKDWNQIWNSTKKSKVLSASYVILYYDFVCE